MAKIITIIVDIVAVTILIFIENCISLDSIASFRWGIPPINIVSRFKLINIITKTSKNINISSIGDLFFIILLAHNHVQAICPLPLDYLNSH